MKKKITKALGILLTASMCLAGFTGCGNTEGAATTNSTADAATTNESVAQDNNATVEPAQEATADNTDVSGTISLAGSTSMEKLCEALMEGFMEAYPNVTVTTEYTGSGAGLESLAAGSVDIGNASRHIKDSEAESGAVENVVALDGIAVITDLDNDVTDLSTEDLAKVYTGEIKNWSELGGKDEAIVVIGRESGSGTRDAFEELVEVKDACAYAQELDSTGAVLAKVAATPGAIGYVSLDVVDDTVTAVALNGVEASEENILAGTYALQRPFVMATMGTIDEQNELVSTWFDYINSEEGKEITKSVGLIIPE